MAEPLAFLFPGQGSQSPGMGADLCKEYREYREVFYRASEILGYNALALCLNGSAEELSKTEITQPLVYTASAATLAVIGKRAPMPLFVAGHSLGEYAACLAAEIYDFETGLKIVVERARLMEKAAREQKGRMLAVLGIGAVAVERAVRSFGEGIAAVANYNSPEQVVVSVEERAVDALKAALKETGAKRIIELPVGGAFHSPLMQAAAESFAEFLGGFEFNSPRVRVVLNETGSPEVNPEAIKASLANQLVKSVQWERSIRRMIEGGAAALVEVGPGRVLTKLNERMAPEVALFSTDDKEKLDKAMRFFSGAEDSRSTTGSQSR